MRTYARAEDVQRNCLLGYNHMVYIRKRNVQAKEALLSVFQFLNIAEIGKNRHHCKPIILHLP